MRPITAFIGVRISWLTVARKRDLLIEAWMASSWAWDEVAGQLVALEDHDEVEGDAEAEHRHGDVAAGWARGRR